MTKPVIVNRVVKDSPLTTAEHDANFANLQNATVGLQAGSAGTTVTSDLNGVITLVAGAGVTFTGDNTAKTITVDAGAANLTANTLRFGASDLDELNITPPIGFANKPMRISYQGLTLSDGANVITGANNSLSLRTGDPAAPGVSIVMDGGIDQLALRADAVISLEAPRIQTGGVLNFKSYTTTERNALTSVLNGSVIYNDDINALQYYDSDSWNTLIHADSGVTIPTGNNLTLADGNQIVFGGSGSVNTAIITAYTEFNLVGGNADKIVFTSLSANIKLNMIDGGTGTGVVEFTSTSGTPDNTTTPQAWLKVAVGGTTSFYYLPLYS